MRLAAPFRWMINRPGRGRRTVAQVRRAVERAGPFPPAGARALELGCGGGAVAAFLAARGLTVTATDLDPREVRVARARRPPGAALHGAVMDAAALALADGGFHLVVAQHMLHHVPDWTGALAETARVLTPGGRLVWIDFALPRPVAACLAPFSRHVGVFTGSGVRAACEAAGLRVRLDERAGPLLRRMVLEKPV